MRCFLFSRKIIKTFLFICVAVLFLAGCGAERESTVLVTDSSQSGGKPTGSAASEKTDSHPFGYGEEVEPFPEGSDPLSGKGTEESAGTEASGGVEPAGETMSHTESGTKKKPSFLETLFHREPTTLDDSELEILRQARLVYLVFKEKKLFAREKAKKMRDLLRDVGCDVVVRFCGGESGKAGLAIADAVTNGAGTVILEFSELELMEEQIASARNAGVRFITLGDINLPGLSPDAVMLPDETMGVRMMAAEAAGLYQNGSYLFVGGTPEDTDLAEQFDEVLGASGRPFARAGNLSYMAAEGEERLLGISNVLKEIEDLRFVLCPDTASARDFRSILKKLKRTDIGILCLYGEENILEMMEKGYVQASAMMDTDILAASVMNAFESLAEKGNAGDFSLCYINTLARMS